MIQHDRETIRTLNAAAAGLPRRRAGKPVSVATLYRWASHGCRGVKLETIQIGGTRCTSVEALQRFFEALGGPASEPARSGAGAGQAAPIRRHRHDDAAVAAELDQLGF